MKLYDGWKKMMEHTDTPEFGNFWNSYIDTEEQAYKKILSDSTVRYCAPAAELAKTLGMTETIFAGFLDGINTSLKTPVDYENVEEDTVVDLDIDYEKLYYNMHEAKAEWLYKLKEWDNVLSEECRKRITKEYRSSKQYRNTGVKIGPNDPCPCGSGKKYKKCCGKAAD